MNQDKFKVHLASRKIQALAQHPNSTFYGLRKMPVQVINTVVEYATGYWCGNPSCILNQTEHDVTSGWYRSDDWSDIQNKAREEQTKDMECQTLFPTLPYHLICRHCSDRAAYRVLDLSGEWIDLHVRAGLMQGQDMGDTYWMADTNGFNHLEVEMPTFIVHMFQTAQLLTEFQQIESVDIVPDADWWIQTYSKEKSLGSSPMRPEFKRQAFALLQHKYQEWLFLDDVWSPFFAAYVIDVNIKSKEYQEAQWCEKEEDDCVAQLLQLLQKCKKFESSMSPDDHSLFWRFAPAVLAAPLIPTTPQGQPQRLPILRVVSPWCTPSRKEVEIDLSSAPKPKEPEVVILTAAERRELEKKHALELHARQEQERQERQVAKQTVLATRVQKFKKEMAKQKKNKPRKEAVQAARRKAIGKAVKAAKKR